MNAVSGKKRKKDVGEGVSRAADEWRSRTFIFQTATKTNDTSLKFDKTAGKLTVGKCQENGTTSGRTGRRRTRNRG